MMRWLLLLGLVLGLLWLNIWDITNIAASFAGGVLLADDVKAIWRRIP